MAYTDPVLSKLGPVNNDATATWAAQNALFEQIFTGEVLTAFAETNLMRGLHMVRSIDHGKAASFPSVWKASSRYYTPGSLVLGSNQINANEIVIKIDELLLADVFVNELDELKLHYDVRSIYSKELGNALARVFDAKTMRVAILAARASNVVTGAPGGSIVKNTSCATDGEILASMVFAAGQAMDEKDVPADGRQVIFKPAQHALLAQSTKVLNRDWGGAGVYSEGTIPKINNIAILKSNNLPSTVIAAATGENNSYSGTFTDTVGVCFQKQAIGTVTLMDIVTQITGDEVKALYQGTLMIAKMALGHGILRPECAVEISKSA